MNSNGNGRRPGPIQRRLQQQARNGSPGSPSHGSPSHGSPAAEPDEPQLVQMSTVEPRAIDWLWYPWLAIGEFTLIDGDPGVAKSTLTIDLAARVSRGWPMPPDPGT